MSKYEKYKPSGIEWIGDVPDIWQFKRLKNVCYTNKDTLGEKTPSEYLLEYVDIGNTNDKGEFLEVQEIEFGEAPSRARRKVEHGDTIISTVRTYLRAIAFIENPKENLIVSTGFAVLNPIKKILLPKFLFYQVLCESFIQRVIANSEGVSYPAISSTKLSDIKLFIPSIEEQQTIANYLDSETKKIDRLIANKKAQAEKLKELRQIEINNAVTIGLNFDSCDFCDENDLKVSKNQGNQLIKKITVQTKDSGIDWLGKIPEHWEVKRLKNFCSMNSGNTITSDYIEGEGEYPVYGGNGLRGYFNEYTHEGNYVLVGRQGALCGNINYAEGKFWASEHAVVVTLNKRFNHYWVGELLRNMNLNQYSQASAQPGLSVEKIVLLKVPVPPIEEQIQIANYLQDRTGSIDKLLNNIESQIEKLQELRKIKIYEAVTGKIKVPA
jgi:type I restriction enzyme S subunit